jgi:hypothetical protein
MHVINPEQLRLEPGQSLQAGFAPSSGDQDEVGFFLRSGAATVPGNGDVGIVQRAGLIRFDDVLLVVTLIKVNWPQADEEIFDVWWDYHSGAGFEQFGRMAEQEKLTFHFYSESGKAFSLDKDNEFKRFFGSLKKHLQTAPAWTEVDFDRAVRGFCSQAYPKEHLWDMIEFKPEPEPPVDDEAKKQDDLVNAIPENLRPFYLYVPEKGHCINVIPSAFEKDAEAGNPDEYIHPAPVKTVLRCGIRWIKGYPVAPIPFIPGHGLAVPPDDMEF